MTATWEEQYVTIMKDILEVARETGVTPDRTGTGRVRLFQRNIRVDVSDGTLPLTTTRKTNPRLGIEEMLWMIKGSSNVDDLPTEVRPIWNSWAVRGPNVDAFLTKFFPELEGVDRAMAFDTLLKEHEGSIGPMYGAFWRQNKAIQTSSLFPIESLLLEDIPSDKLKRFYEEYDEVQFFHQLEKNAQSPEEGLPAIEPPDRERYVKERYLNSYDQLGEVMRGIKRMPYSARHVITAWIPQYLPFEKVLSPQENVLIGRGALAACHAFVQFLVTKATDGGPDRLSLWIVQRSCDICLGVPTNLVEYATLLHLVAHCSYLRPHELIWSGGDVHGYANHLEDMAEQVKRPPHPAPKLVIDPNYRDIFSIPSEAIRVEGYQHHDPIRYAISV